MLLITIETIVNENLFEIMAFPLKAIDFEMYSVKKRNDVLASFSKRTTSDAATSFDMDE